MSILNRLRKKETTEAVKSDKKETVEVKKAAAQKPEKKSTKKTLPTTILVAHPEQVLLRPLVTEKTTLAGVYAFEVNTSANKSEIKKAIIQVYGVTPVSVRIMNVQGKTVRWNNRQGKRKDWKKAIVQLSKGETISVYEGT